MLPKDKLLFVSCCIFMLSLVMLMAEKLPTYPAQFKLAHSFQVLFDDQQYAPRGDDASDTSQYQKSPLNTAYLVA